jgi:hypothetical protein
MKTERAGSNRRLEEQVVKTFSILIEEHNMGGSCSTQASSAQFIQLFTRKNRKQNTQKYRSRWKIIKLTLETCRWDSIDGAVIGVRVGRQKACGTIPGRRKKYSQTRLNDIRLHDTSSITSDIVVPINSSPLTITLHSSVITTLVYNDTKYSVPFMTL